MDTVEEEPLPTELRVVLAILGSIVPLYAIYLVLDLVFGWGLGWIVLMWIGVGAVFLVGTCVLIALWCWVYDGTARARHARGGV